MGNGESLPWLFAALMCVAVLASLYWHHMRPPACAVCAEPLAEEACTTILDSPLVVETRYRCPRCFAAFAQRTIGGWD